MSAPRRAPPGVRGHTARKRFGQHFLTSAQVLEDLVNCINPQPADRVIEIGPGLGALTDVLLSRLGHLSAVELDRDLVARLRERYQADKLTLLQADALRVDWQALISQGADGSATGTAPPVRLVGNLPYNISSPLLVRLIDCCPMVSDQHFMLQREVVQRIVADGGADYGRLGILLQAFYQCDSVLDVPASAFTPPPKVQSAVVRMRVRPQAMVPDAGVLSSLLAAAFGQRRKMLRGTLIPWLDQRGLTADLPGTARAQDLPRETYYALAGRLAERQLVSGSNPARNEPDD